MRLAFEAIVQHRLRAALTSLGIVFATMAIVAVVSIIDGVFVLFSGQLEELGAGFYLVVPSSSSSQTKVRKNRRLSVADVTMVTALVSEPLQGTLTWNEAVTISQHQRSAPASLVPASDNYPDVQGHFVSRGRHFSATEVRNRSRVVVLGAGLVEELQLGTAVGQQLRVFGTTFTVVGVLESKSGFNALGQTFDRMVVIPVTTAASFSQPRIGGALLLRTAHAPRDPQQLQEEIRRAMRRAHRLRRTEPDDFQVIAQSEILEQVEEIKQLATWVVVAIVSVAMLVGGIGIMNIMLVSVTERTREIGLRMALGARRRDILWQFLAEAGLLGVVGGVGGIALGVALSELAARLIPDFPPASLSTWSLLLSFGFSVGIGLVFGLYPAWRASRLAPSDALRYES